MSIWRIKNLLITAVFGTGLAGAQAADPAVHPTLTLADARALALKNHPQVLASQALSLRADQLTVEARSAYYPTVNGNITGAQAETNARIGSGLINDSRLFNHAGMGMTLSQLISDFGRTGSLVKNSSLLAQASRQDYQASRFDVVLGVDQAYFEVLLAQQLVRVAEQTVKTRQTLVDQVSELAKNQLRSQVDVSFAAVNLADAKLMLLRAQDRRQSAFAGLGQALGTDQAVEYHLADQPMPPTPPATPDALITQAFQNRPELASYRLQTDAAERFVEAERDLKRPTLSLIGVGGALPYIRPGNANPGIPSTYESVAVNLQIPIFNGFLFRSRRSAAEYQLQATEQRSRDLQDRIARNVRSAWADAKTSYEAIGATEQLLKQANLALDLAQGRYNLGLSSIVELTQGQLGQTSAEVQNINSKYEYQEAYAALQYTLGLLH